MPNNSAARAIAPSVCSSAATIASRLTRPLGWRLTDAHRARMLAAGFRGVSSTNPYWDVRGRTFEDLDGYRVVLQNSAWEG